MTLLHNITEVRQIYHLLYMKKNISGGARQAILRSLDMYRYRTSNGLQLENPGAQTGDEDVKLTPLNSS